MLAIVIMAQSGHAEFYDAMST